MKWLPAIPHYIVLAFLTVAAVIVVMIAWFAIVWILSRGFKVNLGVPPAARETAIVSPIAREIASMNGATMPERADGTTTRVV